jgi:peptidyl-prolyl cis-trans isomerase C
VNTAAFDLAQQFGDDFATELAKAPIGQWVPMASGFGLHLVKVEQRQLPPPPKLADVRQRLENDWRSAAVRKAEDAQLKTLLETYDVVIARPK